MSILNRKLGEEAKRLDQGSKSLVKQEKNYSIEFWRFAFAFAIVMMHFNEQYQILKYGEVKSGFLPGAGLGVDFFFLLSGFLLMAQYVRNTEAGKELSPISFLVRKISHIYSHYIVAFILLMLWVVLSVPHDTILYFFKTTFEQLFKFKWEIFMLHMTEFGEKVYLNYPTWYISVMLICSYFTYALISYDKKLYLTILAPMIILVGGGYYANKYGCILIWYDYNGLFNVGWIRGMIDIGLGRLIYQFYCYLSVRIKLWSRIKLGLLNIVELFCIGRLAWSILSHRNGRNDFWDILIMAALIVFSFLQETYISRLFNNRLSLFLGRLSLAIYFNQALFLNMFFRLFGGERNFTISLIISSTIILIGSWLVLFLTNFSLRKIKLYTTSTT